MAKIYLDPNAPRTNAILGAALSGGDAKALARAMLPDDHPLKKPTAWEHVTEDKHVCDCACHRK